jgi:GNAT superfamily N-acetyltransferase
VTEHGAMPVGLVWRAPVPADAEALGRMHHRAWVDAYGSILPDDWFDHWTVDVAVARWRAVLTAPAPPDLTRVAVFDATGAAVAWAAAGSSRRDEGIEPARPRELWGLYVAREHHGTGIARALAERVLGDEPAELWVFDGNPRAEAFYRKLGFERDGVEAPHRETGLPGIRMVR